MLDESITNGSVADDLTEGSERPKPISAPVLDRSKLLAQFPHLRQYLKIFSSKGSSNAAGAESAPISAEPSSANAVATTVVAKAAGETPPLAPQAGETGEHGETLTFDSRKGEAELGPMNAGFAESPPAVATRNDFGDYEGLEYVARGGMGVVYKARHRKLGRVVALKMILAGQFADENNLRRFRIEAAAAAQLDHPNIVPVFEFGEADGCHYFSMGFIEGGSLSKRLMAGPLRPRDAADLVRKIADAVHYAHLQGVIHRDLKPANILLDKDGEPRIADFGLAKRMGEGEAGSTHSGEILGTPSYMPPEQAAGRIKEIGPASDVYSLGAILYCLTTGRAPFHASTVVETLKQVIEVDPVPPRHIDRHIPRNLETICLKAMAKSPGRRYASAEALSQDLARFLRGETVLARPAGPIERVGRWCYRNPAATSLFLALSLGAVTGIAYLSHLSVDLVRKSALESAAQQSEMLDVIDAYYASDVVDRLKSKGIQFTHRYKQIEGAIPNPASMTINLGERISEKSQSGMKVRLYSDLPFFGREGGGVKDDFERVALTVLRADPYHPMYRFEDFQGRPALRYATARLMKEACVTCHNTHPDSPKKNWKVGDVRGVLEILHPLENDVARTTAGLRGAMLLIAGVSVSLLLLSSFGLFLQSRWRTSSLIKSGASASSTGA